MRRVVREAHLLSVILNIEAGPATASNFNIEVSSYEGIDVEPSSFPGRESGIQVALIVPLPMDLNIH
jgi:hypothetical protein